MSGSEGVGVGQVGKRVDEQERDRVDEWNIFRWGVR